MPRPRQRAATDPAVKLSVGVAEPAEDRDALARRRNMGASLAPPAGENDGDVATARAPFAWLLPSDGNVEDALQGPDWAW